MINDSKLDRKIGLPSAPDYAIVDPVLSLNTPAHITAFTGLDAFSHAHEALTEKKNTAHSDLLAYEAIRLIAKWLPIAYLNPDNLEAREHLALASNYAGISFSESGTHIAHSIAQVMGHRFCIAHGVTCALALPPAIEFIATQFPEKIKRMGIAAGIDFSDNNSETIGSTVANWVRDLMRSLRIDSYEKQGISLSDCLSVENEVFNDELFHCYAGIVTRSDLHKILESMYNDYR